MVTMSLYHTQWQIGAKSCLTAILATTVMGLTACQQPTQSASNTETASNNKQTTQSSTQANAASISKADTSNLHSATYQASQVSSTPQPAVTLTIAAATTLQSVLPILANDFSQTHPDIKFVIHYDTSVNLYDTIREGRQKFDIFLSSSQALPHLLYQENQASGTKKYNRPFTYTRGQLALYSIKHPIQVTPISTLDDYLLSNPQMKVALVNPQISLYGVAAENWLVTQNLYQKLETGLDYKTSVDDSMKAVVEGEVDFGLVALSQVLAKPKTNTLQGQSQMGEYSLIPKDSYPPILQDGIVLQQPAESQQFVNYLLTVKAQNVFTNAGYLPICTTSTLLPACK